MIQAVNQTTVEPKATKGAMVEGQGENLLSELEVELEGQDFANELAASLADHVEVQPIEVATDQLLQQPSTLINNLPQSGPEAISPKIFDPSLTKGVEKLINPATGSVPTAVPLTDEQVLALANAEANEFSQVALKTPQLPQTGRSPAIEMTKGEIDPQLLNMEDFVVQKNLLAKKAGTQVNGYGIKPEALKSQQAMGLKQTEVVGEINQASGEAGKSVNSQQFILDMMKDQSQTNVTDVRHVTKVFNMNHVKTDNPNQIMTQITDYIVQAKAAKEPTVSMRVNHDELGMLDITVRKGQGVGQEALAINIGTHSTEGKNFFQHNSKELFSHLTQAGLSISDVKVETPSTTAKNDFDMSHQGKGGGQEKNFGSEQNQRRHEADRRQDLWKLLQDKEAA